MPTVLEMMDGIDGLGATTRMAAEEARSELSRALKDGSVAATGRRGGAGRVDIPKLEWQDLGFGNDPDLPLLATGFHALPPEKAAIEQGYFYTDVEFSAAALEERFPSFDEDVATTSLDLREVFPDTPKF
jgi:hypothetical protein